MRLPKKPITSFLTCTGRLPSDDMISPTRSACFTSVWTERTTSTSGIRCAGMKKCRPSMRPWVFRPLAISLIGKLEEFEVMARIGPGERFHLGEQSLLQRQVFGDGLDHEIDRWTTSLRAAWHRSQALTYRWACPWRPARRPHAVGQAVARRGRARHDVDLPAVAQEHGDDPHAHGAPTDNEGMAFALRHFSSSQTRRMPRRRGSITAHI